MNLYQCVKAAVTTKQAAEYYGIQVGQNSMIRCPFHDDHHPSMKVDVRYYCFACHATGDVISFTAHLFGLSIYEVARKLAVDFGIDPMNPTGGNAAAGIFRRNKASLSGEHLRFCSYGISCFASQVAQRVCS